MAVVTNLLEPLLANCYAVRIDSGYDSPELVDELKDNKVSNGLKNREPTK